MSKVEGERPTVVSSQGSRYFLEEFGSIIEGVYILLGKSDEIENGQADSRWGRSHLGSTFEDSLLLWPPRPTNWLAYPKSDNPKDFPKFSRDNLLLQSEQKNYQTVDNLIFLGEQNVQNKSPDGVLAEKRFAETQKNLSKAYSKDINIKDPFVPPRARDPFLISPEDVPDNIPRTLSEIRKVIDPVKYIEAANELFVDIPVADKELIKIRSQIGNKDLATFVLSTIAITSLCSIPRFRPLSSPISGLIGGAVTTGILHTKWQSYHGTAGLNKLSWSNRIRNGWSHVN